MNTGLEYWNTRWQNAPTAGDGSWDGDEFARRLEQAWILKRLSMTSGPILDLGCGAGALFEGELGAKLYVIALQRGYLGVDGSTAAIVRAQKELPGLTFEVCDLSQAWPKCAATTVISRRLLQNLPHAARLDALCAVGQYKHGILLECTRKGLVHTNAVRSVMGHYPALREPEFNEFLTDGELVLFDYAAREWPLGHYYALTRGVLDTRNSEAAYNICVQLMDRPLNVPMGLVAGIYW